jgi:signal transduction histidine kinase
MSAPPRGSEARRTVIKQDIEQRIGFLDLGPADLAALAALGPVIEDHADALVSAFYRHLLSFEPTRRLLADPEVKRRLLVKQREYLLSLTSREIDEDFVEERLRIGVTHERIGLSPRWYLGAYALYFSLLAPIVTDRYRADPDRGTQTIVALMKLLMLDAQLAMEAYIERHDRELEFLNRELAASGLDLERELREQRVELRQTAQRARAAEDLASVATLVAGLAHEIGTPMGVIQGHAELLESAVTDERGRWRLRTIREQIDRISRIIQALLSTARPRQPELCPLELEPVLDTTLSFLAEKFRRRGITVERAVGPVPSIHGDAEKLQQLFLNLLLNAVDAMPGGGRLRVSVDAGENGDTVVVRVADTGTGIPAEKLPFIFDPFYTTKEAGQGSGLGLVVARAIVADHDGRIDVASEEGVGTEFRVELPISRPIAGAGDVAQPSGEERADG